MSKPAALGTAIALCFFIVTMIVLISLIVVKIRRRKAAERRRKHARKISLQEKMPPHHAFTLPRTVTTPWDTAPCMGRRRDEVLMSRGPFYFRWPMYLEDFTTDKIKMGMDIWFLKSCTKRITNDEKTSASSSEIQCLHCRAVSETVLNISIVIYTWYWKKVWLTPIRYWNVSWCSKLW